MFIFLLYIFICKLSAIKLLESSIHKSDWVRASNFNRVIMFLFAPLILLFDATL